MINEKQSKAIFEHEKERIEELSLWSEVPALSANKMPFHIHPIALVRNAKIKQMKTWADSPFRIFLRNVESGNDYSAYNRTRPRPMKSYYKTNLETLTIKEVM